MSEKKRSPVSTRSGPYSAGATPRDAFHASLSLARQAERLGFNRYWLAEHHNMTGIASAATSVLIGYLAANTTTLRLGSGGIMLPNHAPLVIAEQFGTLESLYPGRIDLGLGRAPGSDQRTMMALRRHHSNAGMIDSFPEDVETLIARFDADKDAELPVQPVPGLGLQIPVWLLGSSLYSAQLAAKMGLPFAFASHFAPDLLFGRCICIVRISSLPNGLISLTPWYASISSPPTAKRGALPVHVYAAAVYQPAPR